MLLMVYFSSFVFRAKGCQVISSVPLINNNDPLFAFLRIGITFRLSVRHARVRDPDANSLLLHFLHDTMGHDWKTRQK